MATIAIFGGTGYAGSAIRDEALVDRIAAEADVIVISIRFAPTPVDVKLIDAFPALTRGLRAGVRRRDRPA
jgi:nucleoside-diphosphate-sugar epimerase